LTRASRKKHQVHSELLQHDSYGLTISQIPVRVTSYDGKRVILIIMEECLHYGTR